MKFTPNVQYDKSKLWLHFDQDRTNRFRDIAPVLNAGFQYNFYGTFFVNTISFERDRIF